MAGKFEMQFDLGNEAFDTADKRADQIGRCLRHAADKVETEGDSSGYIWDGNGNRIGQWSFDPVGSVE